MKRQEFCGAHKSCLATSLRLSNATLHCGQSFDASDMEDNELTDIFYGDAVPIHTKLEFESDFVGPVKMGFSHFPKKWLEEKMEGWPGGTWWLDLEGKCDEGVDLIAIGYKYNSSKVISFICTKGAGNTMPGDPYKACWMDSRGNHSSCNIPWPYVIAKYFNESNCIDMHNHARQADLKLEKKWITNDGYFCIFTTILGITVIDSMKAYKHCLHY
jgi:hypothetical protein